MRKYFQWSKERLEAYERDRDEAAWKKIYLPRPKPKPKWANNKYRPLKGIR